PNPAGDFVTIDWGNKQVFGAAELTIYDQIGNKVSNYKISENSFKISTSHLVEGVYFAVINNGKYTKAGAFVVKH
ncbi:MAG: T9SS type A sorting domain-containing protein, partial [Saprospiraceae bacterium]|nr:T9SS type A sorting domain-containing protein [Saprospiraceae bacterium]